MDALVSDSNQMLLWILEEVVDGGDEILFVFGGDRVHGFEHSMNLCFIDLLQRSSIDIVVPKHHTNLPRKLVLLQPRTNVFFAEFANLILIRFRFVPPRRLRFDGGSIAVFGGFVD